MITYQTRETIRAWVLARIADEAEVSVPDLTDEAVAHFQSDSAFTRQFLLDNLEPVIYELARRVVAETRDFALVDGRITTPAAQQTHVDRLRARFANWLEHAGDRHVRLMEMTKRDLMLAKHERQERGDHEHRLAMLWGQLAAELTSNQQVRHRFTEQEVADRFLKLTP